MIREKIDASKERTIILCAITNTEFLKAIRPAARPELFKSPYAQTIWRWCVKYFDEYQQAPNKDIQDIYISHKMEIQDDEEEEILSGFLASLSKSEEVIGNVPHRVNQAMEWLNLRALELIRDELNDALLRKDIQSGQKAIAEYGIIKQAEATGVSLLSDVERAVDAFQDEGEYLFSFPGAMGAVIGACKRSDFISFLGFTKIGKSHWLIESAKMAMLFSLKVLFVTLEMPMKQIMRRFWLNFLKKPKSDRIVRIPHFVEDDSSTDDEPKWVVEYEEKQVNKVNSSDINTFKDWIKKYKMYFHGGDCRIAAMPARSVTVNDIMNYVDNLQYYENWEPDVIVLDYADLIKSSIKGEVRHQLDDIWANLRRIALERNICVVTASQSGRGSANADATEENIAEDIRKVAHVTKMIAINATKEEKANGIYRIAQIAERDDNPCFNQAYVLNCLDLGQVCLDSRFRDEVLIRRDVE